MIDGNANNFLFTNGECIFQFALDVVVSAQVEDARKQCLFFSLPPEVHDTFQMPRIMFSAMYYLSTYIVERLPKKTHCMSCDNVLAVRPGAKRFWGG